MLKLDILIDDSQQDFLLLSKSSPNSTISVL